MSSNPQRFSEVSGELLPNGFNLSEMQSSMPLKQSNYNQKASYDTFAQKFEALPTEGLDIEKLTEQQMDLQNSSLGAAN